MSDLLIKIHKLDLRGNVYTLMQPVLYKDKKHCKLVVPVGFLSDGASVPRFFWRVVFPPGDTKALRAAFLHDYIYRTHPFGWTKQDADNMFYDVLVLDGISKLRAYIAYLGVHLFGKSSWKQGE